MQFTLFFIFALSLSSFANFAIAADSEAPDSTAPIETSKESLSEKAPESSSSRRLFLLLDYSNLYMAEVGLDLQFKIGQQFTLGPIYAKSGEVEGVFYGTSYQQRKYFTDKMTRETFGLRGAYYLKGTQKSSSYAGAHFKQKKVSVTGTRNEVPTIVDLSTRSQSGTFSEREIGITGGYQWIIKRFVLHVGGGIAHYNFPDSIEMKTETDTKFDVPFSFKQTLSYTLDMGAGMTF